MVPEPGDLLGGKHYSSPVDLWSAGAIFGEMVNMRPLFPGESEIDQIFRIFRTLGTPNALVWPDYESLPEYKANYPQWRSQAHKMCPGLNPEGMDLLVVRFCRASRLLALALGTPPPYT